MGLVVLRNKAIVLHGRQRINAIIRFFGFFGLISQTLVAKIFTEQTKGK
tara:strand:- start:763 stop:909 length:147 start_codon:yes stop_codon:yes gene_type:complete